MKIAIASEGKNVSGHFGYCEGFKMYEVEGNKIVETSFKENPGHKPGFLPVFLKGFGTNLIIAGGMGATAQDLFNENGIEVIVGAQGECDNVIEEYIKGNLKTTGNVCAEHEH